MAQEVDSVKKEEGGRNLDLENKDEFRQEEWISLHFNHLKKEHLG